MLYSCLFDLDGTVYKGHSPIEGAINFINRLNKNEIKYKFVTNRSDRSSEEVSAHLNEMGVISTPDLVITSAMGAAALTKGRRAYVLGSNNLKDCIRGAGAIITDDQPEDVVIGFDGKINFDNIRDACQKILSGARFLATNPDIWIQSGQGVVPENGSILAAITSITKIQPIIAGKPNPTMIEIALLDPDIKRNSVIIIGDNLDTDIAAANSIGLRSILLLTGVTNSKTAETSAIKASWIAKDYKALEAILFS